MQDSELSATLATVALTAPSSRQHRERRRTSSSSRTPISTVSTGATVTAGGGGGGGIGSRSAEIRGLFCTNSSLRGVPRIFKAESVFLRCLWLVFVLLMVALLLYSSSRVLANYLEYDVAIQTSVAANEASAFPAITLCSHYPFAKQARSLWSSRTAESPTDFSRRLRNLTRSLLLAGEIHPASALLFYDKVSTYYQNLPPRLAVSMGHSAEDFLLHCMITIGNYAMVGKAKECQLRFQLVSHPRYFNCYSVVPIESESSRQLSAVYLILSLGDSQTAANSPWERAFVMDVFDQAHGLRLLLHEAGLHPDIEHGGVHIEPGKMVEIAFETVLWQEARDSPIDMCHAASEPAITDLDNTYAYSFEACKEQAMNRRAIARCGCLLSRLPRPRGLPSRQIPYCGDFRSTNITQIVDRLKCLKSLGDTGATDSDNSCRKRCSKYYYKQELSITRWRATDFQLHWMLNQSQSWKQLKEAIVQRKSPGPVAKQILNYLDAADLTQLPDGASRRHRELPAGENSFAYVIVRRKSFDTTRREEKLTVTFEALVSRVGGLCSLCLGLTMAFFVEIVEFLYLAFCRLRISRTRNLPAHS